MGSRTWIKIYCDKWVTGTLREDAPDVRGVWIDLLTLAGSGQYGDTGEVKLTNGIGFTDKQISEILRIQPSLWRRAKERFLQTERIEISPRGAIRIINWRKYQSEYNRQKPYRQPKEDTSTSKQESPLIIPLNNPPIRTPPEKENENEKESEKLQLEVTTESYKSRELSNNSLSLRGATPPLRRHPPSLKGKDGLTNTPTLREDNVYRETLKALMVKAGFTTPEGQLDLIRFKKLLQEQYKVDNINQLDEAGRNKLLNQIADLACEQESK